MHSCLMLSRARFTENTDVEMLKYNYAAEDWAPERETLCQL